jgi:hypothetical protein
MKRLLTTAVLIMAAAGLSAQVIITDRDMFNEAGLYWRGYASGSDYPVASLIGDVGGPQLWDFTGGPQETVLRFDYLEPGDSGVAANFPGATFVERKKDESTDLESWLFLEKVAGQGRRVYGAYDENTMFSSAMVFSVPVIDFPATIRYGDTWSTATSWEFWLKGFEELAPMILSVVERYEVDAYGILDLPGVGFGDCLRVNCLVEWNTLVDLEGTGNYQTASTDFSRSFFFLRPGLGIAAQITSFQEASPPSNNFNLALEYVRLFETNKEPAPPCDVPFPVTDLRVSISAGTALLKWTKAECTNSYRVEYTGALNKPVSWTVLGTTTGNFYQDKTISQALERYYRVISLP